MTDIQDLYLVVPTPDGAGPIDPRDVAFMWDSARREAQKVGRAVAGPMRPAGEWDAPPEYQHDGITYRRYSIATVPATP